MDVMGIALFVTLGWFCYGKFVLAMSFTQGYGVKRVKVVAGMPAFLAAFFLAVGSLIALFLWTAYQSSTLQPQTIANIRACGWSMASGVATAVGHWYFYGRRAYFLQSEYNIRVDCAARGDSPEVVEATIVRYRSLGIVQ